MKKIMTITCFLLTCSISFGYLNYDIGKTIEQRKNQVLNGIKCYCPYNDDQLLDSLKWMNTSNNDQFDCCARKYKTIIYYYMANSLIFCNDLDEISIKRKELKKEK